MTNAEKLLGLTLYGRAALSLGYPNPKPDYALSLDVDAVLWIGQAETLERESNFWSALEQVNAAFESDGLYMTHLFDEDQVVLRATWREKRVVVSGSYENLKLYRLADADLLLSKMMRYDPTDLDDLCFVIEQSSLAPKDIAHIVEQARLPESEEIEEQFALCRAWLVRQGLCAAI